MRRARDNDGFALITSIVLLTVMMGLGLGLLFLTDSQQKASGREQASEAAFNVAEAALNAQIGQLARAWPGTAGLAYEPSCTAATSAANGCPTAASLNAAYPNGGSTNCPAGTPKDAWGSPLTNEWTTYVRDQGGSPNASAIFNSANVKGYPTWAAHEKVWVRSVGVVQCRMVVLVALVSPQFVTLTFPQRAIAGNWFETTNNGNKEIINTQGGEAQSGGISMRCTGLTPSQCEQYQNTGNKEQVKPDTKVEATPSPAIPASSLEALKKEAESKKTYFKEGVCPANLAELTGKPVYIEGPCTLTYTGGKGNSAEKPGFLVIVNGTFELDGNAEFFGTVYAVNAQNSSAVVVAVHGTAKLTGSIIVDGNGGLAFGSSGSGGQKEPNFVYSPKGAEEQTTLVGASATRNSFRVLPINQ